MVYEFKSITQYVVFLALFVHYLTPKRVTSKTRLELGGIPATDCAPYAYWAGIISRRVPPTFMPGMPAVQPWITPPLNWAVNGWPLSSELWKITPVSAKAPV